MEKGNMSTYGGSAGGGKIGIVYDHKKPEAEKLAREVIVWLRERDSEVYVKLDAGIMRGLDFVVTFGGDGLVLHTANKVALYGIPLLRVNFGYLGYLTNIEAWEMFDMLEKVLSKDFFLDERTRIEAEVFHGGQSIRRIDALNEMVIGGINRIVSLKMDVLIDGGNFFAEVRGDGAIFSTKTGSTAYNINAGGPVLFIDAISVVANNAYFKSNFLLPNTKAFVTSVEAGFRIEVINQNKLNLPYLVADGQRNYRLKAGDYILIKKSPAKTFFMETKKR